MKTGFSLNAVNRGWLLAVGVIGSLTACATSSANTSQALCLQAEEGGNVLVQAELARDFASRARGLMQRIELDQHAGMLFYYPQAEYRAFWMYQTLIPLDIAYLSDDGEILQVITMQPCASDDPSECQSYPSSSAARAALELNAGAFAQFGISEGDYVYEQNCQQTIWHNW